MKKAQAANLPQFEIELLKTWENEQTFAASLRQREGKQRFSFYDGPPFANGLPHYGHVVPVTLKDSVTRYKTMRGYYVPRRNGWDTHGLPVETEVEKQLGIKNKRQILEMGVDKFIKASRDSVFKYRGEWEQFFDRIGRWADKDNAYATLDDDYIESVWWAISELNKKGLLYESFRSMPYCPRCATPLSNFEVNQNYKDDTPDPSVYVKFALLDDPTTDLLAWTTTPWTLAANAALAVDAKADYVTIELKADGDGWAMGEKLVLAKKRLDLLDLKSAEYKVVETRKGSALVGIKYTPLYKVETTPEEGAKAYRVYADDSVSLEDGTGILHVAPRYGETDLDLGQREGLPLIESVDSDGMIKADGPVAAGQWFKDADTHIIADLTTKGRVFAAETFTHTYPFCWRCDSPLMYFATPSWNVAVTKIVKQLVLNNQQITWVPDHVKAGRFGNWLADARDWGISRNRFWGNPLPIWRNVDEPSDIIVVGSLDELKELAGKLPKDLHRPEIDKIVIKRDSKTYHRVEEVLDCWFESGAMPFASNHYPFNKNNDFNQTFPADFIAEGIDQTRGWFYTLHVLATALFGQPAFKNVAVNGHVLAADGLKLSKRLRNYPPLEEVFDTVGVDVLRFFMMSSPVVTGENVRFSRDALADVQRNVFLRLWNVHSFFTTYAEVDNWQPSADALTKAPESLNVLDRWMLARLDQATGEVTKQADSYQLARATRPIIELIDDLSNWYVRRSRRRFWKSDADADKQSAYSTLHFVLIRTAQLLAPWSPFMADKLWRELTVDMGDSVPKSVHLSDWPEAGEADDKIIKQMADAREVITKSLSDRAEHGIKVRQPLAAKLSAPTELVEVIVEELNIKVEDKVTASDKVSVEIDFKPTPELLREGMARDIIRQVQQLRKAADLRVDQRIKLSASADDKELFATLTDHKQLIADETLATKIEIVDEIKAEHQATAKISGVELTIGLQPTD